MFGSRLKLDKALLDRAVHHAAKSGYASVEEFISCLIETELAKADPVDAEDAVKKRLKGLGYIS